MNYLISLSNNCIILFFYCAKKQVNCIVPKRLDLTYKLVVEVGFFSNPVLIPNKSESNILKVNSNQFLAAIYLKKNRFTNKVLINVKLLLLLLFIFYY
jgi:hypothetical protein